MGNSRQQELLQDAVAASHMDDKNDLPLFMSDNFRIYCMKVLPCNKRFCHDWTVCPFAHTGEKAKRRDPCDAVYTGIACVDMKKDGTCIRGDNCPYAHNVFEYWLHPTRYRTQLCNDGPNCRRRICFFAHTLDQLRVPASKPYVSPEVLAAATAAAASGKLVDSSGVPAVVAAGGQRWRTQSAMPMLQRAPPPPAPPPGPPRPHLYHTRSAVGLSDPPADLQGRLAALQASMDTSNSSQNQLLSQVESESTSTPSTPSTMHRTQSERPAVRAPSFGSLSPMGMQVHDDLRAHGARDALLGQLHMQLNHHEAASMHGSEQLAMPMPSWAEPHMHPDTSPPHLPYVPQHTEQLPPMPIHGSASLPPAPMQHNPFAAADAPYNLDSLQHHLKQLHVGDGSGPSAGPSTISSLLDSITASSHSGIGIPYAREPSYAPEAVSEASTSYRSHMYRTNSNCSSRLYSRANSHETYTMGSSLKEGGMFGRIASLEGAPFDISELEREEALRSLLASGSLSTSNETTPRDLRASPGGTQHRPAGKLAAVQESGWQGDGEGQEH